MKPREVKDLIKQHFEKVAVVDAEKLNKEDHIEERDIGTKSDPNFRSLAEILEMQPPFVMC